MPRVGGFGSGSGDRLEITLTGASRRVRAAVSMDQRQQVTWEKLEDELPRGTQAAIRHDAVRRELCYELAIPLRHITGNGSSWRELDVSVMVWDDQPRSSVLQRRFRWGGNPAGNERVRSDSKILHLDPLTSAGGRAARTIVHAAPDVLETRDTIQLRITGDES